MPEIEAFEPVNVVPLPSATLYRGVNYRSDRQYTDANGDTWTYRGLLDGASLWQRGNGDDTAWNITAVVDQFGPLTPTAFDDMTPQTCPKGEHPDWAVDSEETFDCPWCRIEEIDKHWTEALAERDAMHDVADGLAYAIAPIEWIGEHSSGNDPWQNALDHVTPAPEVEQLKAEIARLITRETELAGLLEQAIAERHAASAEAS